MSTIWTENNIIPIVDEYDVCVVGGGVAGVAAALSAAREGARTCLIEKEYALGGLATLGLIVYYLPLCDGKGRQVIAGISEELLKASIKYAAGDLPECWADKSGDPEARKSSRYRTKFEAAPFIIAMEEMLTGCGVHLIYDRRFCGVHRENGHIDGVIIENKSGRLGVAARMVIDATGDADVCHAAGEKTVSWAGNVCTGWYFANGGEGLRLRGCSDPIHGKIPEGHRFYAGDRFEDVTQHAIDGRRMIMADVMKLRAAGDETAYPFLIPTYDGMRMTRRLSAAYTLDESEAFTDFEDSVGLTGDWRKCGPVFALPWRTMMGVENDNLAAAGRCISVTNDMWDITRVIPTAALTGEITGLAAAMAVRRGLTLPELNVALLQDALRSKGNIIEKP